MVIDWAHPREMVAAFAVASGVFGGGYALVRVMFAGGGKTEPVALLSLPAKTYKRIVIPTGVGMCEDDYVGEAAPLAAHLAQTGGAGGDTELVFTYVIPVPRALPLSADLPDEEAVANTVLDAAANVARRNGIVNVRTLIRKGRTVVDETVKTVEGENADLVVLTPQSRRTAATGISRVGTSEQTSDDLEYLAEMDTATTSGASETMTGNLLRRLNCELMVARRASATVVAGSVRAA